MTEFEAARYKHVPGHVIMEEGEGPQSDKPTGHFLLTPDKELLVGRAHGEVLDTEESILSEESIRTVAHIDVTPPEHTQVTIWNRGTSPWILVTLHGYQ